MLFRFLGKIFLYFFIIPSIVRTWRSIRPTVASTAAKAIRDIIEDDKKNEAKSREDHPAGSRLS